MQSTASLANPYHSITYLEKRFPASVWCPPSFLNRVAANFSLSKEQEARSSFSDDQRMTGGKSLGFWKESTHLKRKSHLKRILEGKYKNFSKFQTILKQTKQT